jgi:hypothetical protein
MKELQIQFSRDGEHYEFRHEVQDGDWRIPDNLEFEQDANVVSENSAISVEELLNTDRHNFLSGTYTEFEEYFGKIDANRNVFFPQFSYSDITERILFGFFEIEDTFIKQGLWASYGKRTFQARFPQFGEIFRKDGYGDLKLSYSLVVKTAANEMYGRGKLINADFEDNREQDHDDLIVNFTVDTDALGEMMQTDLQKVLFELGLQVILSFAEDRYIFVFPIHITLLDPKKLVQTNTVAIDFGTSSTCVAYRKGTRSTLLSLQDDAQSLAAYENPTNLMIQDWEAFRSAWSSRLSDMPVPTKNSEWFSENWHFDQGHQLRNGMKDASPTMLTATIDELKLVPYRKMKLGKQDDFIPAKKAKAGARQVHLVCEPEDENDESLDPIAFYGYLLGRAINRPINLEIPLKYTVTVPVKFDMKVRESIRKSLEFGLKLSLPKTVRDEAAVRIGHEEPVAFIRAVIGNPVLKESGWESGTPMPFAVFDFGGGTLDFSYGVYREANDEEIDEHDHIIEILRTSGHEEGGAEHLIHWLSYEIYKDHDKQMNEHEICFPKPATAEAIEFFPEKLLRETPLALTNLRYINENCSRALFKGEFVETEVKIDLFKINGDTTVIEMNIQKDSLTEELNKLLEAMVESFASEMRIAFADMPEHLDELHIFRAGNASRSEMIANLMEKHFPIAAQKRRIHFIDEKSVHGIKPKTAVALGQLALATDPSIGIVKSNSSTKDAVPFIFNVGVITPNENNRFDVKIPINSLDKTWQNLGRYNKETYNYTVYYTNAPDVTNVNDTRLKSFDIKLSEAESSRGTFFWARAVEENVIEYMMMKPRQEPDVTMEGTKIELTRR